MKTKYRVVTNGSYYKPQLRFWYWPFWFDMTSEKGVREDAEKHIDWHRKWTAPYRALWTLPASKIKLPEQE